MYYSAGCSECSDRGWHGGVGALGSAQRRTQERQSLSKVLKVGALHPHSLSPLGDETSTAESCDDLLQTCLLKSTFYISGFFFPFLFPFFNFYLDVRAYVPDIYLHPVEIPNGLWILGVGGGGDATDDFSLQSFQPSFLPCLRRVLPNCNTVSERWVGRGSSRRRPTFFPVDVILLELEGGEAGGCSFIAFKPIIQDEKRGGTISFGAWWIYRVDWGKFSTTKRRLSVICSSPLHAGFPLRGYHPVSPRWVCLINEIHHLSKNNTFKSPNKNKISSFFCSLPYRGLLVWVPMHDAGLNKCAFAKGFRAFAY